MPLYKPLLGLVTLGSLLALVGCSQPTLKAPQPLVVKQRAEQPNYYYGVSP